MCYREICELMPSKKSQSELRDLSAKCYLEQVNQCKAVHTYLNSLHSQKNKHTTIKVCGFFSPFRAQLLQSITRFSALTLKMSLFSLSLQSAWSPMKELSSLSCEKPPYFNFGVYNLLEVTDYGHFVLKNPVGAHCNIH